MRRCPSYRLFLRLFLAAPVAAALAIGVVAAAPASFPAGVSAVSAAHTGGRPELQPLHEFEESLRKQTDFRAQPAGDAVTGPDPYVVRTLPGRGDRLVSILRGAARLVLLDANLNVLAHAPTPRAPTGLTVADSGDIFVSSEQSPELARFRAAGDRLQRTGSAHIDGAFAIRDVVAAAADRLYAVDEVEGRLLTVRLGATAPDGRIAARVQAQSIGHGPIAVAVRAGALLVNCLLDHALVVLRLNAEGTPGPELGRVVHDGPIWSFDAAADGDDLVVVVGGVEDHPLDRSGGSFGYVDSFLTVYRFRERSPKPTRLVVTNLSALGLVTPKVIQLQATSPIRVLISGYATSPLLTLAYPPAFDAEPRVDVAPLDPGTTSVAVLAGGALVFADPLLDAWVVRAGDHTRRVAVAAAMPADALPADDRDPLARVGEALLFTTLMAPWNRSDGPLSRFTCETCHFEMYGDGRTHHTGRGDVHATTKPLRGLFNNRPHFSRALDPDLTTVANSEFRVAGARSDHDPWFAVTTDDFPWLRALGVNEPALSPVALRKALMTALMRLSHARNPRAAAGPLSDAQRAGAAVFRDRCEGCHQARLVSDDPASRVPFADWEALIRDDRGPLLWGQAHYQKTGVTPYVHENGARVPSLRRLYKKYPYFTNGSARELGAVLARVRFTAAAFWHDGAPAGIDGRSLSADEINALSAFLDLL